MIGLRLGCRMDPLFCQQKVVGIPGMAYHTSSMMFAITFERNSHAGLAMGSGLRF
jgi:hypothetical protein